MADNDQSHTKTTRIDGILTGDHECGLLFPENRRPDGLEAFDEGLYLRDLIPEEAHEGMHEFVIRVEARPIADVSEDE